MSELNKLIAAEARAQEKAKAAADKAKAASAAVTKAKRRYQKQREALIGKLANDAGLFDELTDAGFTKLFGELASGKSANIAQVKATTPAQTPPLPAPAPAPAPTPRPAPTPTAQAAD